MGRAGITLRPCEPLENESGDDSLVALGRRAGSNSLWWEIALFSGAVVKSPERITYSWGPTDKAVLEWAIRHLDPASRKDLASLLIAGEAEQGPM
jgi:hypothetical protein